jgi:2-hydroxychromene-2-carboxylate isomerase
MPTVTLDWYFDFVSPFAYLQFRRLLAEPPEVELRFHPVLLAALLNHWGQLGPAEIPPKRKFTYRQLVWRARREQLPIRMPAAHPFNSLRLLRLALAADCNPAVIESIFHFVWRDGRLPEDEDAWIRFIAASGLAEAEAKLADPDIKEALRRNTENAIARGVFGVPTAIVDGELFWGLDSTEMLFDYCRNPRMFADTEMQRVSALPIAAARVSSRK